MAKLNKSTTNTTAPAPVKAPETPPVATAPVNTALAAPAKGKRGPAKLSEETQKALDKIFADRGPSSDSTVIADERKALQAEFDKNQWSLRCKVYTINTYRDEPDGSLSLDQEARKYFTALNTAHAHLRALTFAGLEVVPLKGLRASKPDTETIVKNTDMADLLRMKGFSESDIAAMLAAVGR